MNIELTPNGTITLYAEHPLELGLLRQIAKNGIRIASMSYDGHKDYGPFYRDYPSRITLQARKEDDGDANT